MDESKEKVMEGEGDVGWLEGSAGMTTLSDDDNWIEEESE